MSESKRPAPSASVRERRSVVIRREDHIGHPIGIAFLESAETDSDAVLARLRENLGTKLNLINAEISHDALTLQVESRRWRERDARLASAAKDPHDPAATRRA